MKKQFRPLISMVFVLSFSACGGQPAMEQKKTESDTSEESTYTDSSSVTQELIEKNIIGAWMKSEVDGQPVLTNEKSVYDIVSFSEAYTSVSLATDSSTLFDYNQKGEVDINGNVVTITTTNSEGASFVHEFTITEISDKEFTAHKKFTHTFKDSDPLTNEYNVTFVKVNDYSDDILGIWEGRCTSEGSIFDDGQEHRWEYKDDETFVYYVKDGENWVPSADEMNEYFVAGKLLCTRWIENGEENREWWEISIDNGKMNWTALREDENGKTFTASFEMTKVEG